MPKQKRSKKRAVSLKGTRKHKRNRFNMENIKPRKLRMKKGITSFNPDEILADKDKAAMAIFQSFMENDPDSVIEILDAHIRAVNKSEFAEKAGISRSTLYDMLEGRKNPTLRVLTQCIHEVFA